MDIQKSYENHFKERMRERFGLRIKTKNIKQIVSLIRSNKLELLYSNKYFEGTRKVYKLVWKNVVIKVVYDEQIDTLVTVLNIAPSEVEKYSKQRKNNLKRYKKRQEFL